jgi:type IV pilus assembly protein PilB
VAFVLGGKSSQIAKSSDPQELGNTLVTTTHATGIGNSAVHEHGLTHPASISLASAQHSNVLYPVPVPSQAMRAPETSPVALATPEAINPRDKKPDIASILISMGVKEKHVRAAVERANVTRDPLAVIARDLGLVSSEKIAEATAIFSGYPYFNPTMVDSLDLVEIEGFKAIFQDFRGYVPVGINEKGGVLVAVSDLSAEVPARNAFCDKFPSIVIASEQTIQRVYRLYFARTAEEFDVATEMVKKAMRAGTDDAAADFVQRAICALLRHACYMGASDIYIARTDRAGTIRIKVDGKGQIFRSLELDTFERLINTLVMNSGKSDALRSAPQDTRVEIQSEAVKRDFEDIFSRYTFRMVLVQDSVTSRKNAVIRINDSQSSESDFAVMGFDRKTDMTMRQYASSPTGLVLVTGPTGSGKTTTLYALMREIDPIDRAVFTIERPVEYRHGSWIQHELPKTGDEGDAARTMLKALLREAPDVILIGELRDDPELVKTALAAANTGHLVFATLHTNSAAKAVMRLTEIGAPHEVLASVLKGVLAQRLVGVLCKHCKKPDDRKDTMDELNRQHLNSTLKTPYVAVGCPHCGFSGFRGRKMIYEMMDGDRVRSLIESRKPISEIEKHGVVAGQSLWARGLTLVAHGLTSMDELVIRADRDLHASS